MDASLQLHVLYYEQSVKVGAGQNTNCDQNSISDNKRSVQNVHMVLELQGQSRKYMLKNEENCKGTKVLRKYMFKKEENCKGTKIFFLQT